VPLFAENGLPVWVSVVVSVITTLMSGALGAVAVFVAFRSKLNKLQMEKKHAESELEKGQAEAELKHSEEEDQQVSRRETGLARRYKDYADRITEERGRDLVRYQTQLDQVHAKLDIILKERDDCIKTAAAQEVEIKWLKEEQERLRNQVARHEQTLSDSKLIQDQQKKDKEQKKLEGQR
jgi:hypothetical protein